MKLIKIRDACKEEHERKRRYGERYFLEICTFYKIFIRPDAKFLHIRKFYRLMNEKLWKVEKKRLRENKDSNKTRLRLKSSIDFIKRSNLAVFLAI